MSYFRPDLASSGSSPQSPNTESREERMEREEKERIYSFLRNPETKELSDEDVARAIRCNVRTVVEVREEILEAIRWKALIICGIILTIGLIVSLCLSSWHLSSR